MSTHEHYRPIDLETAEQLFAGDPSTRRAHPRLDAVLTAASAPARVRELAGEDAALAAFTAARLASPHHPRRIEMLKTTLAKLLTVKVAAICVALGGAGGVALAAGTGALPGPLHKPAAQASGDASYPAKPSPSGQPSARPGNGSPADLFDLCRRYSSRAGDGRRHALDEPEFGNLVSQAGRKDRDRVDHFCVDLRKPRASGSPSSSGKPPARSSSRPDDGAPGNSGQRPGDLPSGSPDSDRAGR
jgi:hypothetical protein